MIAVRRSVEDGAREPVLLEDLKAFSRIVDEADDRTVESLLLAARVEVERHCGHVLVPGTFDVLLDEWTPTLRLLTPLREVTAVVYRRTDGSDHTVDPTTYDVDVDQVPGRVLFRGWPITPYGLRSSGGVVVTVKAGYAKPIDVPEDIRQTVMTAAALMYEHRDDPDMLTKVRQYIGGACIGFAVDLA